MESLTFVCDDCRFRYPVNRDGGTGYAIADGGRKICYGCCAEVDLARMRETGKATLYLTMAPDFDGPGNVPPIGYPVASVSNWPGTLRYPVYRVRKGRHNMAGVRYDFAFEVKGTPWVGVTYGDNTQIAHCRKVK